MVKILSIDFDYFQIVSPELIKFYPEGYDYTVKESVAAWKDSYGRADIGSVSINEEEMFLIKGLLGRQTAIKKAMIAGSHKNIYDFVKGACLGRDVLLYNIDMHHDMFNKNPELDCGNWIGHLSQISKQLVIKWVCNPVSEEVYGLNEKIRSYLLHSIREIDVSDFDYVFLCRSDAWVPPHLDCYFDELSDFIIKMGVSVTYDEELNERRSLLEEEIER